LTLIELIAVVQKAASELHLVALEEVYSDEDHPFTLFVNRDHLSHMRTELERKYFWTLDELKRYAADEWGVPTDGWQNQIVQSADLSFEFELSKVGVPVPIPIGFDEDALVVVRKRERSLLQGGNEAVVAISGTPEGLRYLAALFLLTADSAQWDEDHHIHLERDERVDTNIAVTIRGPGYADDLANGRFQDATSGVVALDTSEGSPKTGNAIT
jgi:hypothetical protein